MKLNILFRAKRVIPAETFLVASPYRLMWWKFRRHKVAIIALLVLTCLYLGAVFCEFIAPANPHRRNADYIYAPCQRVLFFDKDGAFHLRPFVYYMPPGVFDENLVRRYTHDQSTRLSIRLLVRGDEYKLWGLFPLSLHLFGLENGTPLYLLGSDNLGRDLLSRAIYGSRISLSIGLVGVFLSVFIGCLVGGISGYFGGWIDTLIQRLIETLLSLPTVPLWMGLSAALPAKWPPLKIYFSVVIILSLLGWTGLARVVRGKVMALREEDYAMAARLSGAKESWIIRKHLLPSFFSYIVVHITLAIPGMIIGETTLSYLGIGLRSPVVSWGVLLQQSQNIQTVAQYPWILSPAILIIVAVLAFNFVGDGLRDAADPYAR
jgi:peptide/nickel transport system permease protein